MVFNIAGLVIGLAILAAGVFYLIKESMIRSRLKYTALSAQSAE